MGGDGATSGTVFWLSHLGFCVTGLPMVLLLQQEAYDGGNQPKAFFGALATYGGLLLGGLLAIVSGAVMRGQPKTKNAMRTRGVQGGAVASNGWRDLYDKPVFGNGACFMAILPIAVADIGDKWFMAFAIKYAGAQLYIVFFSSLTVFTALIRRFGLGRKLLTVQWVAIVVINLGLASVALNATDSGPKKNNVALIQGIGAAFACAFTDALFYVFTERARSVLPPEQRPSENDICTMHGLIGMIVSGIYVLVYFEAGEWKTWVLEPIQKVCTTDAGMHPKLLCQGDMTIFYIWLALALIFWLHYITFYYCTGLGSSVASGVNKSVQSVSVFVFADLFYCHADSLAHDGEHPKECMGVQKGICAGVVFLGVMLYSLGPELLPTKLGGRGKNVGKQQAWREGNVTANSWGVVPSDGGRYNAQGNERLLAGH